jgi:hypothetical protein
VLQCCSVAVLGKNGWKSLEKVKAATLQHCNGCEGTDSRKGDGFQEGRFDFRLQVVRLGRVQTLRGVTS